MHITDKLIIFSKFLASSKDHRLSSTASEIEDAHNFISEDARFWRDKSIHNEIQEKLRIIDAAKAEYNDLVSSLDDKVVDMQHKLEADIIRRDYVRHTQETVDLDYVIERQTYMEKNFVDFCKVKIGQYSDWRWAGVEINPSTGMFTESMLGSDPLYIMEKQIIDVESVKQRFNKFFVDKRMMFYSSYDDLPQGQIGVASCINLFDFWPIDYIKEEMRSIMSILAPGGHLIFSYNDCEIQQSLDLCAGHESYKAFNTKTLMEALAGSLGYDIIDSGLMNYTDSWMVVKKPGALTTHKLSAPLVSIDKNI